MAHNESYPLLLESTTLPPVMRPETDPLIVYFLVVAVQVLVMSFVEDDPSLSTAVITVVVLESVRPVRVRFWGVL